MADSPEQSSQTAILMIAHGSRRQEANDDLVKLADMVRAARPEAIVIPSFLELAEPSIPQGAEACVEQGATEVLMFPYFLSAGRHVVEDLTGFRDQFQERWPDIPFQLCEHLGLHPLMVEIVFARIEEAASERTT